MDYHNAGVDAVSSGALVTVGGIAGGNTAIFLLASKHCIWPVFCAA